MHGLLLLFFGVLLACVLRGAPTSTAARTGAPVGLVLALVIIAVALGVGGLSYWIAPELIREGQDLWTHAQSASPARRNVDLRKSAADQLARH